MEIELKCWSCGEVAAIEVAEPPMFGFELAWMANDIGWLGSVDMIRHRVLVFCSAECRERQRTKAGTYRVRPCGITPITPQSDAAKETSYE